MSRLNDKDTSWFLWLLVLTSLCPIAAAQQMQDPTPPSNKLVKLFPANCGSCHGLDGRGGERGPDIASNVAVQKLSDTALTEIVRDGVPGTGMPGFDFIGKEKVRALVAELRTLQGQGSTSHLPGSSDNGKAVFFGKAGCAGCHMASGTGGFMGSDLTAYARNRDATEVREAITHPANHNRQPLVTATTLGGQSFTGVARNEDNFTLQLQTTDGAFHFLVKSSLRELERRSEPLMPSDYATRLSAKEIDDVVSYLLVLSRNQQQPGTPENRKNDDESEDTLQ